MELLVAAEQPNTILTITEELCSLLPDTALPNHHHEHNKITMQAVSQSEIREDK